VSGGSECTDYGAFAVVQSLMNIKSSTDFSGIVTDGMVVE
jgi:hypothetical protein